MPSLEKAMQAMYWAADSDQVGYSQPDRDNVVIYGPDLYNSDCSRLTIKCLQYAGFDTGYASYSGDIVPALVEKGWKKLPVNGNPQPGDVLVAEGHHVALMLHDGNLGQASQDEHGGIDGRPGDQTGWEVNTRPYYDYPWTCYLRWTGEDEEEDDMRPADNWEYYYVDKNGKNTAPGGNMYNCAVDTHKKVTALTAQITALSEAVKVLAESKGADPQAIAKAVDKAVKARLEKIQLNVTTSK